jgi:hypothetical protein
MRVAIRRWPGVAIVAAAVLSIALSMPPMASAESAISPSLRLDNEFEIADAIVAAILKSHREVDGTAFVGVRVAANGTVTPGVMYGTTTNDPVVAALIRDVTAHIQFLPDGPWEAAHPDRTWAVFWMFQTNGCEPKIYTAPRDVTAIRVCLKPYDDWPTNRNAVLFEGNPPLVELPVPADGLPELVPRSLQRLPYPTDALRARRQGVVIVRGTLDGTGRIAKVEMLADTAGPLFRPTVQAMLLPMVFESRGTPVEGREVYVRIEFRRVLAFGRGCVDTRTPFPGTSITICGSMMMP